MSKLDDLIQSLCPEGVERFRLGDVAEVRSGWGFPHNEQGRQDGKFPFYKVSDMNLHGNEMEMHIANNYISENVVKKLGSHPAPAGTVIFPKIGAAIGTNKKRILVQPSCYDNNVVGLVPTVRINPKFLFFLIQAIDILTFADFSGALPSIRKSTLEKYLIPLPPLEVQEEIVRILDKFTIIEAELEAELEARLLQYTHYRNNLLAFSDENTHSSVSVQRIEDVCTKIFSGGTPNTENNEYYGGEIPWVRTQEVNYSDIFDTEIKITDLGFHNSSAQWVPENNVIVAMYGASAARVAINKIPVTTNQACCNLVVDSQKALYKFVYYWLANEYEKLKSLSEGAQPNLNAQKVKQYPIPVPPLPVQEKIVAILDRFNALANDLKNGLPAEIAARHKQYEYYRNQLLTFKEKGA